MESRKQFPEIPLDVKVNVEVKVLPDRIRVDATSSGKQIPGSDLFPERHCHPSFYYPPYIRPTTAGYHPYKITLI